MNIRVEFKGGRPPSGKIRSTKANKPNQLNIRVDRMLEQALDEKGIEFSKKLGDIPSRSELVRTTIEQFLDIKASPESVDQSEKV